MDKEDKRDRKVVAPVAVRALQCGLTGAFLAYDIAPDDGTVLRLAAHLSLLTECCGCVEVDDTSIDLALRTREATRRGSNRGA